MTTEKTQAMSAQGTRLCVATGATKTGNAEMPLFPIIKITATGPTGNGVAHGLQHGDTVVIVGGPVPGYHTITTTADPNVFTITVPVTTEPDSEMELTFTPAIDLEAKTYNLPGGSPSVIDATTLASEAKRKRVGLTDSGQISGTVLYTPGHPGHELLLERQGAKKPSTVFLALTNRPATIWKMSVFVLTFGLSVQTDGLVESAFSMEIDGAVERY